MRLISAVFCYFAAFVFIYAGFNAPGADALNHGFPRTDAEIVAALLISTGMIAKLFGHIALLGFASARRA
jgi:hypothetical protein